MQHWTCPFRKFYSYNMIGDVDICKNLYVHAVPPSGTAKFQEFFFWAHDEGNDFVSLLCYEASGGCSTGRSFFLVVCGVVSVCVAVHCLTPCTPAELSTLHNTQTKVLHFLQLMHRYNKASSMNVLRSILRLSIRRGLPMKAWEQKSEKEIHRYVQLIHHNLPMKCENNSKDLSNKPEVQGRESRSYKMPHICLTSIFLPVYCGSDAKSYRCETLICTFVSCVPVLSVHLRTCPHGLWISSTTVFAQLSLHRVTTISEDQSNVNGNVWDVLHSSDNIYYVCSRSWFHQPNPCYRRNDPAHDQGEVCVV